MAKRTGIHFTEIGAAEEFLVLGEHSECDRATASWQLKLLRLQVKRDELLEKLEKPFPAFSWDMYEDPEDQISAEIVALEAAIESNDAGAVGKRRRAAKLAQSKEAGASDYFRRVLARQIADKVPLTRPETYAKGLRGSDRDRFGGHSYKTVTRALRDFWWRRLSASERETFTSHGIKFPPLRK